jgi:twinkle protein
MNTFLDYGIKGIELRSGGQQKTLCPQCSHTRQSHPHDKCLSVNVDEGTWYCHHCDWKGGLNKDKKQKWESPPTPEPIRFKQGTVPDRLIEYMKSRCITQDVLNRENVSCIEAYNKEWIAFPYVMNDDVVNVKYRGLDAKEFRQTKNGYKCFYRIDKIKNFKNVIICEGEIDALSFLECGIENVVSVPEGGINPDAKNITTKMMYVDNCIEQFDMIEQIYIAVDSDAVGRRLCEELARRFGKERCMIVRFPEACKDANDVLCKLGKQALWNCINDAEAYPIEGVKIAHEFLPSLYDIYEHGFQDGAVTGAFKRFDNHFTWHAGQLTVVTGVPSFGKSNFIDHIMIELAKNAGWKFAVFSPENPSPEIWLIRLSEILTGKSFESGNINRMTKDEVKLAMEWIARAMFYIMPDSETFSLDDVLATSKLLLRRFGINMLVIDPWNNLEMQMQRGETENLYVGRMLAKMRMFASKTGIHIVLIAHPRKMNSLDSFGNFEVPTPYSISGSSNFYNIPHNILIVHRDFEADGSSLARIMIAKVKNKYIGKVNKQGIMFTYNVANQSYSEIQDYSNQVWT